MHGKRLILGLLPLLLWSTVVHSQEYLEQFPLRQQTRYFDFRYKRNPDQIKIIAKFADGFIDEVNRDFFRADFAYPIRVLVLEDRASFQDFLRRQFGVANPPNFGIFLFQFNLFATYEDSGLGTFAHEIMHPLVERNLRDRPVWAIEGIPTFFEKFYGYWEHGEPVLSWGYQNPWRIEMLGTNLTQLDLKKILSTTETPGKYQESDRRLVSVFLWEQGKFKKFLQLVKKGEKSGYDSYFEAAMEMPVDAIVPLWRNYLKRIAGERDEIMYLPPSTVAPDKSAFQKFIKLYGISALSPGG